MAGKPGMHKGKRAQMDPEWQAKVREKIKTSLIVKALSDHVLGEKEMQSTQITAGLGLLKKVVPDLSAVDNTVSGPDGGPVVLSSDPMSAEDWAKKHTKGSKSED